MNTTPKPRLPRKLDRCEVCHWALDTRPDARRRRCAEHLDQLHLFSAAAVRKPRRWPGWQAGGES